VSNINPNQFDSAITGQGFSLGNGGDRVLLFNSLGVLHDFVVYDDLPPWPTAANGTGPSLELVRPSLDNNLAWSWGASATVPQEGTPGALNSIYTADRAPMLDGISRTVPLPIATETVTVTVFATDDVTLSSVQLWVDTGSGFVPQTMYDDGLHGDGSPGNSVFGASISAHPDGTRVRYYVAAQDNAGQSSVFPLLAPSEYRAYTVGWVPPAIEVSEMLASNLSGAVDEMGQFEDWAELRNRDIRPVDLGGMFLTNQFVQSRKWMLPPTVLQPGAFLLVWCDNDAIQGPLHTTFKLDRDGGDLGLFDSEDHGNTLVHGITYGLQNTDVSFGFFPDDADAPDYLAVPTPAASNAGSSMFSPVLIAELQTTSAAGGLDDVVELFNRSAAPVDLTGWHLTDDLDVPTKYTFPAGSVVAAGGRWLVDEAQLGFGFSSTGSEVVQLTGPDGLTGQDYFDYGPQSSDVTQGRYPQDSGNWHFFAPGSLGSSNSCGSGTALPPVSGLRFTARDVVEWSALAGAQDYDLIRGNLMALRASLGNFAVTGLTCAENDSRDTRSFVPELPPAGGGFYWIARGATYACGYGTWNTASARQVASRDAGLGGSGTTCP
jgi:hypothetical protein